ncbi:proline-, glutamic acid- and leucine-rich protein 1-like [Vanessa cardui]|uniref:proline-, glutamic acid- and leucine-rich protein 1-like n=1 Tax=Vanessa cardui TaxID=171605 RepID=UPI001F12E8C8|nr:proline-, glutamic acid- and leucine-rich protein 1-like [Vanessa cardui]
MDLILNKVQTVDPNDSDAVKEALSVFFQNLVKQKDLSCNKWLRELKNVINRFPKYCMQHRSNTENYLASFISSNNYFNVIEAAKCAHALQQVRPTKEKTATPKSSWRDQIALLCNTAHTLISAVFPNAVDMYKDADMPQTPSAKSALSIALTDVTKNLKNVKDKQSLLQLRLKNVLVFIQAMLVEIYPVAKPIRPQIILDVIVRALSVTSGTNSNVNISSVKTQALRTLDALIVCLGSNLIPFSPLVIRCVMQTLRWSSENSTEDNRIVRSTAYNTLSRWLNVLHVHRTSDSRNLWEDELTGHIVDDITPLKKIVQLTMGPQPTKHLSKKAKRKLAASQLQDSTISAHMPGEKNKIVTSEVNNEVAIAALDCAEMFLTVCGRFLKPATHKLIQESLVRECYNHASYTDNHLLYLLRALEATRKTTPVTVPPPTQYCLHLYSVLVNVQNSEIAKFCTQALLDIRLHLHCSPPSLNFALEPPKETENEIQTKNKISEKNRAVLQSLLGPDKVPTAAIENEIITIADEPSNKRPRLDIDEADQISLSSDSVRSVEMCDDSENNEVEVIELNKTNNISKDVIQPMEDEQNVQNASIIQENTPNAPEDNNTQDNIKDVNNEQDKMHIYEAATQMPLNTSTDTIEEEKSLSQEVSYDYPNKGTEKVTVLEKMDDDNLPSTNDTDDIQITCGQVLRDTEEIEAEKKIDDLEIVAKVNGVQTEAIENGDIAENAVAETDTTDGATLKLSAKTDGISVEDMLADFVDEVIQEAAEA